MGSANEPIVVVGGTGLVGRAVVKRLVDDGRNVHVVSRKRGDLPKAARHWPADLTGAQWQHCLIGVGPASLIYLAYSPGSDPAKNRQINFEGLRTAAHVLRPENVVFASSVVVFGTHPPDGEYDEQSLHVARTLYAQDKLDALAFLEGFAQGGRQTTALHLSIVYGDDCPRTVYYRDLLRTGYIVYKRDGSGYHNLLHADDAADAIVRALDRKGEPFAEYVVNGEQLRSATTSRRSSAATATTGAASRVG